MVVKFLIALSIAVLAISTAHGSIHGVHSEKLRVRLLRRVPTGPNPGAPHAVIINKVQIRPEFLKVNPTRLVPTGPNPIAPHAAISDNIKMKINPARLVSTRHASNLYKVQIRSEFFKTNLARLVPTWSNPGAPPAAISDNVKMKIIPTILVSTGNAAKLDKVQIQSEFFKTNPARLVPTGPNPGAPHATILDNVEMKINPTKLVLTGNSTKLDKIQIRPEFFKTNPVRLVPTGPNPGAPRAA